MPLLQYFGWVGRNHKAGLVWSHLGVSRAAKAVTAPNPFHRLPGKS